MALRLRWASTRVNRCTVTSHHESGGLPISGPPLRLGELVATFALGAGQRVRPAARVAAAVVPPRGRDVCGGGVRRRGARGPSTGSRCSATSGAPATRTRSPPSSATRSPSSPRRWCSTPRIRPMSSATWSRSRPPDGPPRSTSRSWHRSKPAPTTGRSTTSRPAARWRTCWCSDSISAPAFGTPCASPSSGGTGTASPQVRAGGDPAGDARRAPQPRHGGDRPPVLAGRRRSMPLASAAAARTTRSSRISSPRTEAPGSTSSPRWTRGTPCSTSSPSRTAPSTARELDEALTVAADFIDLKSPYMAGHSRRCAQLAADAAAAARTADEDDIATLRGLRSSTSSARPPSRTRSGTSPAAHARGVRSRRASPHAHRADAPPLTGPRGVEPGGCGAPREGRRVRLPQGSARR